MEEYPMTYINQRLFKNNSIEIFSRKEAQEILGIGKTKILSLSQSGELTSFRLSETGPYRIRRQDLEEFIENRLFY